MFNSYISKLKQMENELDSKKIKKLQLKRIISLFNRLDEDNVSLIDHLEMRTIIENIMKSLSMISSHEADRRVMKNYQKDKAKLFEMVKQTFELHPEGDVQAFYMSMGMVFGVALSIPFQTLLNSANMAIGIGVGMSIGVAIGANKEKQLKAEGKIF
jgi:hypothetical protein